MDTTGFATFVTDLSKLGGVDFEHALVDQTGKLLSVAARDTPARAAADIERSVRYKNRTLRTNSGRRGGTGEPVIFGKKNGAIFFLDQSNFVARDTSRWKASAVRGNAQGPKTLVNGKSFHIMNSSSRRWNPARWARYQAALALLEAKKIDPVAAKGSRGLAKRSWQDIADALAIQIDLPGYARGAMPARSRRDYINGYANRLLEGAAFYIDIVNDYPALADPTVTRGKLNGPQILQRAIAKRLRAFEIDMEKGVFDDLARRAQRYPGIFVAP